MSEMGILQQQTTTEILSPVKQAFHIDATGMGGQWQPLLDVKKEIPVSATL